MYTRNRTVEKCYRCKNNNICGARCNNINMRKILFKFSENIIAHIIYYSTRLDSASANDKQTFQIEFN